MTDTTDTQGADSAQSHLSNGNGKYQLTTLGKLGSQLPIGIDVNGNFSKEIESKPWRFKEEKALGAYREENKGVNLGGFVTHMMGMMMARIGPHIFTEATTEPERTMIVNQLYMADVLYMYAYLRKVCLGRDVDSSLSCPVCELKNDRVLDLDGLDVTTIDDPAALIQEVELFDGVKIFGEFRKHLQIRPPTWMVMQNQGMFSENIALRTELLINECIIGAEGIDAGNPIVIVEPDMDEMTKRDIELLSATITDTPGPRMAIELRCSRCKRKTLQLIDWQYDSFFSSASPSQFGKT